MRIEGVGVNTPYGNLPFKGIDTNLRCITGGENHLYPFIKEAMDRAVAIDIIVSFIMESGVRLLENDFKKVAESSKKIRILTGNYLNITQPSALYLLKDIMNNKADIRFYSDKRRSFHPKAYIFHYENGDGDIFIGSSNISKSAMKQGVEWNYRIRKEGNEEDFNTYLNEFERLFLNEAIIVDDEELKRYSQSWVRPKVYKQLEEKEDDHEEEIEDTESEKVQPKEIEKIEELFKPRGAQIEALYELNRKREEDWDKALVVAATGIG